MGTRNARLSDTDWALLKALWDRPPQTMGSIVQGVREANPDNRWNYKTFFTYLDKLCTKGFASFDIRNAKADRLYYPLLTREQAMEMESESLLSRISANSLPRLIATMARSEQLSDRDHRRLMKLVAALELEEEKRGEQGG